MAISAIDETGDPGRLPPQDLEAEEAVLGAMLISEVALGECLEHLKPEDFYRTTHAEIFRAIRELAQGAQKIDQLTVSDQLQMRGTLDEVGGKTQVFALAESPPVVANARRYAEIVRTNATLRGLIRAGGQIAQLGYDRPGEVEDLVDQAQQVVYDLARHGDREDFAAIRELLADAFVRISELSAGEGAGGVTGIGTGFRDLDRITAGLQRSNLVILAARPSMGKTSLALNIAEHVAVQLRQPVALFSLEMSKLELAQRLMCSVAGIDQGRLRTGQLANDDWPKLSGAVDVLSDAPFYIDDSAAVSVLEIRSKARRLEQQTGQKLGLVVVDYLQLMTQPGGSENRVQEISQISRALKVLGPRPRRAGARAEPALARRRAATGQAADPLRPARVGIDRAGRRRRHVHLPRLVLPAGRGRRRPRARRPRPRQERDHPRQAPQRADGHRRPALPGAVHALHQRLRGRALRR